MANVSPLLKKGAILVLEPTTGIPLNTIHLQYNPESIKRSLQPQSVGDQPDRTEVLRLKGPPIETISCDVEIDATDQLASSDPTTLSLGIQPQLATLELLVYPSSAILIANEVLSLAGTIEILPMSSNLTVFIWGANRVTPVRLTSIEITEDTFDPNLNPIRAKVSLAMRVLNVNDVGFLTPAGAMYMAYQMNKEALSQQG
jgi:Contractile injection system tube protein